MTQEQLEEKGCVGLLNCQSPEKCGYYPKCVDEYMLAEIRDDIQKIH